MTPCSQSIRNFEDDSSPTRAPHVPHSEIYPKQQLSAEASTSFRVDLSVGLSHVEQRMRQEWIQPDAISQQFI